MRALTPSQRAPASLHRSRAPCTSHASSEFHPLLALRTDPRSAQTALSLGDGEYAGRDDHFSNLGVVHAALGAHSQAAAFFQKAVDSARLRGVGGWKSACHSGRLGMALAANGEHEAAYSALLEAVNELGGATRAAAMLSLAAEAQAAGRSADGAKFLEQAFLLLRYGRDTVPSADADAAPAATE